MVLRIARRSDTHPLRALGYGSERHFEGISGLGRAFQNFGVVIPMLETPATTPRLRGFQGLSGTAADQLAMYNAKKSEYGTAQSTLLYAMNNATQMSTREQAARAAATSANTAAAWSAAAQAANDAARAWQQVQQALEVVRVTGTYVLTYEVDHPPRGSTTTTARAALATFNTDMTNRQAAASINVNLQSNNATKATQNAQLAAARAADAERAAAQAAADAAAAAAAQARAAQQQTAVAVTSAQQNATAVTQAANSGSTSTQDIQAIALDRAKRDTETAEADARRASSAEADARTAVVAKPSPAGWATAADMAQRAAAAWQRVQEMLELLRQAGAPVYQRAVDAATTPSTKTDALGALAAFNTDLGSRQAAAAINVNLQSNNATAAANNARAMSAQAVSDADRAAVAVASTSADLSAQAARQSLDQTATNVRAVQQDTRTIMQDAIAQVPPTAPMPPENPLWEAPYHAGRVVVDQQTQACNALLADLIKPVMFQPGTAIYRADTGVFPILRYPIACTTENVLAVGMRPAIWNRAQAALTALAQVAPPFGGAWPDAKSNGRVMFARLCADWLTCVYGWASIAYFATNIQPRMLYAAGADLTNTDKNGVRGQYLPDRAYPSFVNDVLNTLKADPNGATVSEKIGLGPQWMGFYDEEDATGWLEADFKPERGRFYGNLFEWDVRDLDQLWPDGYDTASPVDVKGDTALSEVKNDGPWYFWYYQFLAAPDYAANVSMWRQEKQGARDDHRRVPTIGPNLVVALARGWCTEVASTECADHTLRAYSWYVNNHLEYWLAQGTLDLTTEEVNAARVAIAQAKVDERAAAATNIVNATAATIDQNVGGASNPIVSGIVHAGKVIINGLVSLFRRRRRRRAAANAPKVQPVVMRSIENEECAAFGPSLVLPASMQTVLSQIQAAIAAEPAVEGGSSTVARPIPGGIDSEGIQSWTPVLVLGGIAVAFGLFLRAVSRG